METFFVLLAICAGNSPVTGEFPAQKPVMWSFDVFFQLCLNKRLSKHEAGDLRCHRAYYDVIVMNLGKIILFEEGIGNMSNILSRLPRVNQDMIRYWNLCLIIRQILPKQLSAAVTFDLEINKLDLLCPHGNPLSAPNKGIWWCLTKILPIFWLKISLI